MTESRGGWWGEHGLDAGWLVLQIGPLSLQITHRGAELRVASKSSVEVRSGEWSRSHRAGAPTDWPPEHEAVRVVLSSTPESVTLMPRLPEKPVITRPEGRFVMAPGVQTSLWVSTPLWAWVGVGEAGVEVPIDIPKATWFGSSTRDGTLAWASRTSLRTERSLVPRRSHRAIVPMVLHNEGKEDLVVDRLRIPARHLAIHATADGTLWTNTVLLEAQEEPEMASVRFEPPAADFKGALLVEPREPPSDNLVLRAFARLLTD